MVVGVVVDKSPNPSSLNSNVFIPLFVFTGVIFNAPKEFIKGIISCSLFLLTPINNDALLGSFPILDKYIVHIREVLKFLPVKVHNYF